MIDLEPFYKRLLGKVNSSIFVVMIFTIRVVKDIKSCQVWREVCDCCVYMCLCLCVCMYVCGVFVCTYLAFYINNVQSLPYIVISYIINKIHIRQVLSSSLLFCLLTFLGKKDIPLSFQNFDVYSFERKVYICGCLLKSKKSWIRVSSCCQEKSIVILLIFHLDLKSEYL